MIEQNMIFFLPAAAMRTFSFSPSIFSKASQSAAPLPKPATDTASCLPTPQKIRCEPAAIGPPLETNETKK